MMLMMHIASLFFQHERLIIILNSCGLTRLSSKQQRGPTHLELLGFCAFKSFVTDIKRLHVLAWGLCTDLLQREEDYHPNGENYEGADLIWRRALIVDCPTLCVATRSSANFRPQILHGTRSEILSFSYNFIYWLYRLWILWNNCTYFSPQWVPLLVCLQEQLLV